jgi:hypothetical protein
VGLVGGRALNKSFGLRPDLEADLCVSSARRSSGYACASILDLASDLSPSPAKHFFSDLLNSGPVRIGRLIAPLVVGFLALQQHAFA